MSTKTTKEKSTKATKTTKATKAKTTKGDAHPQRYLIAYNSISASLWSLVLFNTVFLTFTLGQPYVFQKINFSTTLIQTLAIIEIVNSAIGLVKSPLFTTVTQVFSRLLIVWGIHQLLPSSPANFHWCFITLCLSWSITEIIRYSYYASNLKGGATVIPNKYLTWLRYSTFYVLYPTGVFSEVYSVVLSLNEAKLVVGSWYAWLLRVILVVYIPGFYMLYTYMIKQRKKVLGTTKEKKQ
ncbi:Very-long-chain [Spathaspora sp. JA1]|nr:Very-long-chain [Spathaspora sp. JA1]